MPTTNSINQPIQGFAMKTNRQHPYQIDRGEEN